MLTDEQKAILKRQVSASAKLAQQVMHPALLAQALNSAGPQKDDL